MIEIEARKLTLTYRNGAVDVPALAGIDWEMTGFTALVGASGCGKTTLLKTIAGIQEADEGSLVFRRDGLIVDRPKIGFMFQDARLLPWLTVKENLALAFPAKEITISTILEKLKIVGLAGWENAYPDKLSGGMAQRAALARALCRDPELLLLDEPFGALDAITRKKLQDEMGSLWSEIDVAVLLVTHDIEEAVFLADRVAVMREGRLGMDVSVALGRPRDRHEPVFQDRCREVEKRL